MGDIADMMLEGELCSGCGVYLLGQAPGTTRLCANCKPSKADKASCPVCRKKIKLIGLADHMLAKHAGRKG